VGIKCASVFIGQLMAEVYRDDITPRHRVLLGSFESY